MKFPMEDNARKYITTEAVTVENTAYYRRAVQDGDLILVNDEPETTVTAEQDAVQVKAKAKRENRWIPMSEIQFDTISGGIRKPGVHFEFYTRLAVNTLPGNEQRVLVIGPMLSGGTATPLNAVSVYSEDEADLYFGPVRWPLQWRARPLMPTAICNWMLSVLQTVAQERQQPARLPSAVRQSAAAHCRYGLPVSRSGGCGNR